jgi:hypothetical protein
MVRLLKSAKDQGELLSGAELSVLMNPQSHDNREILESVLPEDR